MPTCFADPRSRFMLRLMAFMALACGHDKGRTGPMHDGDTNDTGAETDLDGDGHLSLADGGDDCDDSDPETYPGAPEDCVGWEDTNCDGVTHLCELAQSDYVFYGETYTGFRVALLDDMEGDGRAEVLVGAYLTPGWEGGTYLVMSSDMNDPGESTLDDVDRCVFRDRIDQTEQPGEPFTATSVGDLDGGGTPDLAFGHPYDTEDFASQVFVFEGEGLSCRGQVWVDAEADVRVEADYYSWAGDQLAGADLDGDGQSSLVVGADNQTGAHWHTGAVYILSEDTLFSGRLRLIDSPDTTIIEGTSEGEQLGGAPMVGTDIDGDGMDDLAVGAVAPGGVEFLFLAGTLSAGGVLSSSDADGTFSGVGKYLTACGAHDVSDVNGDGYDDLLIGAPAAEPAVHLWYGAGGTSWGARSNSDSDVVFVDTDGSKGEPGVGMGAGSGGDMDQDGRSDIVVYGAAVDDSGRASFLYGASIPASGTVDLASADARFSSPPETSPSWMTGGVAGGKDVDGDGIGDLLLGDMRRDSAYLIPGW